MLNLIRPPQTQQHVINKSTEALKRGDPAAALESSVAIPQNTK